MNILKPFWRPHNAHNLITAFVVGLFVSVLVSLHQSLAKAETSVRSSLTAVAFLRDSVTDQDAAALTDMMKSQDPEIRSVTYTSKEQALQEAMKDPGLAKSLVLLKSNPLPASFQLQYSDRAWWERYEPAEKLRGTESIQEIRWDPQAHSLFRTLHGWRLWMVRFSAFLGMIVIVWALIGLYRFLSLQGNARELAVTLAVGWLGGTLAWGLWGLGLRSFQADLSALKPVWVWLLPMVIGAVTAQGNFGLEVRHAE